MKKLAVAILSLVLCVLSAVALPISEPLSYIGNAVMALYLPSGPATGDRANRERSSKLVSAPQSTYFSQDFSSSTSVASYASTTPNSGQFNVITTSGGGTVVSITDGRLQFTRSSNIGFFSRTTDFSPAPSSMKYSMDLTVGPVTTNSSTTTVATFQVGSSFNTGNSVESSVNVHAQFGLTFPSTTGLFRIRNVDLGANSSSSYSGTQRITWLINNSGASISYVAPNGSIESLANDRSDIWVGNSKALDEVAATTPEQTLTDLKFVFNNGTGTIQIDNINIEDIPPLADYTNLQFPSTLTVDSGQATDPVYGRIFEAGVTEAAGGSASVTAELGYGPLGSDPRTSPDWTYFPAAFNAQVGNDDEYVGTITAPSPASTTQYAYTYRFSLDSGSNWIYADLNGNGTNTGLTFDTAQLGTLTVNYVEPLPGTLSWSTANQSAGEASTAQFTVQRTSGSDGTVTIDYSLQDAGATGGAACTADVDYVNTGGTVEFLSGETSKQVNVQICDDSLYEGNELFNVILADPTGGATLGSPSVTQYLIEDNDIPSVGFASATYHKREGSTASVVITRTGATNATALVNYSLSTAATAGTCGSTGVDYAGSDGSVEFQIGETEKTITIQLCEDSIVEEPNETIELTLDSAVSAEIGSQSTTTLTILDELMRSMWVWGGTPNPVTDPSGRAALIARASAHNISDLYVSVRDGGNLNAQGWSMYPTADVAALVAAAHSAGIKVWYTSGDPAWQSQPCDSSASSYQRMQEVVAYNAFVAANERFDGVMLDVEPGAAFDVALYVGIHECFRSILPSEVKLGTAINAFWDAEVELNGETKPEFAHIIDLPLDQIVVMGYRDNAGASGGNGIIGLDEDEIDYASSIGKTGLVLAGLETKDVAPGQPENITFFEEGALTMESEASLAAAFFDASSGFGGFSIHAYQDEFLSGMSGWPAGPSAAPASISGRVLTASGAGIRGAVVTVQGLDGGVWSATTNTFGRYEIGGLTAGASYVVTVSSRRYSFANGTQLISLDDNISGLDFTAGQ